MRKIITRLRGHLQEYVSRYAVLATAILVPVSGWLGTEGAKLGGIHTSTGKALLAVATALGTAATAVTFIRNLGIWQMLDQFGTAPGVAAPTEPVLPPPPAETDVAAATLPDDEQMGAEALPVSPDIDRAGHTPVDPALPPDEAS